VRGGGVAQLDEQRTSLLSGTKLPILGMKDGIVTAVVDRNIPPHYATKRAESLIIELLELS
jgi:hypothetical protein